MCLDRHRNSFVNSFASRNESSGMKIPTEDSRENFPKIRLPSRLGIQDCAEYRDGFYFKLECDIKSERRAED